MRRLGCLAAILVALALAWFLAYALGNHTGVERHGPAKIERPYTDVPGGPSPIGAVR